MVALTIGVWAVAAIFLYIALKGVKIRMGTPDPLAPITQAVADLTSAVQENGADITAAADEITVAIQALKNPTTPVQEIAQLASAIETQVTAIKHSAQTMVGATQALKDAVPGVPPAPVTISTDPTSVSLSLSGANTQPLKVTDSNGQDVTASSSFTSDNPGVATVDASGLVTGVSAGSASINVTSGTATAAVPVSVAA